MQTDLKVLLYPRLLTRRKADSDVHILMVS